jgi:hypothetical protein
MDSLPTVRRASISTAQTVITDSLLDRVESGYNVDPITEVSAAVGPTGRIINRSIRARSTRPRRNSESMHFRFADPHDARGGRWSTTGRGGAVVKVGQADVGI